MSQLGLHRRPELPSVRVMALDLSIRLLNISVDATIDAWELAHRIRRSVFR